MRDGDKSWEQLEKEAALTEKVKKAKAGAPVVPPEQVGKSTKLADLPHGEPDSGFTPWWVAEHEQVVGLLTEIRDALIRQEDRDIERNSGVAAS